MKITSKATEFSVKQEHLLQAVINAVPAPIFYKDSQGRYLGCNNAFENYIGLTKPQLIGKTVFELFDLELAVVYDRADQVLLEEKAPQIYEAQVKYADGSLRDVMFHKAVFNAELENIDGIVGVILDVTDRKRAERELEKLAVTDNLTGLGNRYYMVNELERALARSTRNSSELAFLMLDLDSFKAVNDTYGHSTGDALIVEVAARINRAIRKSDLVARIGGDEFAIALEGENCTQMAQQVASKVIELIREPFDVEGHNVNIGVSIGIAVLKASDMSASELMKKADSAMYFVKENAKGSYRFAD